MFAYTAHEGYWLANVNNRAPTPVDGAWHVTQIHPDQPGLPDWIYFEYNRAHMTIFRYPGGTFSGLQDFRVDAKNHMLIISRQWLTPGSDIFKGRWDREADTITLTGSWGSHAPIAMTLKRKQMPVKDHGY
jgi:hypothetical protein